MPDAMQFPESWKQFLHDYQFRDSLMEYTNGAMLIPSFRVAQMVGHYFQDAAPVVRCRECRYYIPSDVIYKVCTKIGGMNYPCNDDFCSWGQRRDQSAEVRKKEGESKNAAL